ncbi:MAG TPA: hypothetical protein VL240_11565 [Candidatus Binatia bacterium]|nr:hypothetical protein [Candidatus Binatia bacterium]
MPRFSAIACCVSFCLALLVFCSCPGFGQADEFQPNSAAGPTGVLVHSRFGGQIFGFDIDQNGTEGLLAEARTLSNGNVLAAVETFDQATGNILNIVALTQPTHAQDDFVTMGVVGNSVGLFEHEHVGGLFVTSRTFSILNPLSSNRVSGVWIPPIGSQHIIMPGGVSRSQGAPNVAVFAYDNSGQFIPWVFSSNVANNTFGPIARITDSNNFGSVPPPIAYDSATNQALLGGGPGCFGCRPVFAVVDLTQGTYTEFVGIGFGFINGLAIDAADGIACSTTEDDANVEFYDLSTQTGFSVVLPGSGEQQFYSGADVEFDPIHKLFLIAQPNSSSAPSGSTIYVYDIHGNLQETINGFSFSNTFNVVATHIALHPSLRSGYVDGPDQGVTELQAFTY